MARHLMAVCVVCLLCADHLPCKQHFEETTSTQGFVPDLNSASIAGQRYVDTLHLPNGNQRHFEHSPYLVNKRRGRTKRSAFVVSVDEATNTESKDLSRRQRRASPETMSALKDAVMRVKRHAGHHHLDEHEHSHQPAEYFVRKLFKQFGDAETETMNVNQFEQMMLKLNMYELSKPDRVNVDKSISQNNKTGQCISSTEFVNRISSHEPSLPPSVASQTSSNLQLNSTTTSTAPSIVPASSNQQLPSPDVLLNADDLVAICPILLYQLTANNSLSRAGCIDPQLIAHDFGHKHVDKPTEVVHQNRTMVWVYAIGAILLASLCGLLAVVVIPCMESKYYHYVLQFFVALGVGTLAGDALLHLMPHAMMPSSKDKDPHTTMTLKGLVAVGGIIFFFVTERALTMIAEWRKRKQKKDKPSSRVRVMREPDTVSVHDPKSEKLCKAKYSSYPYCYDEIDMDTKDDHHHHTNTENSAATNGGAGSAAPPSPLIGSPKKHNHHHNHNNHNNHNHNLLKSDYKSHEDFDYVNSIAPINYTVSDNYVPLQLSKRENGGGDAACHGDHSSLALATTEYSAVKQQPETTENYTIILREHEAKHHGHSHTHGHVHSPPSSMSAVAWMVIMGDGLHNFTDGLAIGAAFSNNIAGGFSTALAVFCHELPHELGDFAILLKAGMSARQAVYYNVLSSVLSFIGTIIGIWIGETQEASSWIFACAAGMFLYIALVDMMPELTSSHKEESFAFMQLLLQVVGMLLGIGIMWIIATFEGDLYNIFNSSSNESHH